MSYSRALHRPIHPTIGICATHMRLPHHEPRRPQAPRGKSLVRLAFRTLSTEVEEAGRRPDPVQTNPGQAFLAALWEGVDALCQKCLDRTWAYTQRLSAASTESFCSRTRCCNTRKPGCARRALLGSRPPKIAHRRRRRATSQANRPALKSRRTQKHSPRNALSRKGRLRIAYC